VHRTWAAIEHGHGRVAVGAGERAIPWNRLEPQIAAATRAVHRLGRAHMKTERAADGRDRSVAVGAFSRALGHAGAACGASEGASVCHKWSIARRSLGKATAVSCPQGNNSQLGDLTLLEPRAGRFHAAAGNTADILPQLLRNGCCF
jgi:hypothetical protein